MLFNVSAASSTHASTTAKELSVDTPVVFEAGRVAIFAFLGSVKCISDKG